MMKLRKALIPAAGLGTRLFPASKALKKELFPIVDQHGIAKPVIQFNIEEALDAGCDEIGIIIQPEDEPIFRNYFDALPEKFHERYMKDQLNARIEAELNALSEKICYIHQSEQEGFGHAVHCARQWVDGEPFLLMLGDHLFKSSISKSCAQQLVDVFHKYGGTVSGAKVTPSEMLQYFGTLTGELIDQENRIFEVTQLVEKPSIEYARQYLQVEGLPPDEFLCFLGMHIFDNRIFDMLEYEISRNIRQRGEFQLTTAQERLRANDGKYYAIEIQGERFDIGIPLEYKRTMAQFSEPIA